MSLLPLSSLREVHDDDYCFLITQSAIWCEAIKETLEQHHIVYECIQEMGSGLSLKVGPYLENYHFYVRSSIRTGTRINETL